MYGPPGWSMPLGWQVSEAFREFDWAKICVGFTFVRRDSISILFMQGISGMEMGELWPGIRQRSQIPECPRFPIHFPVWLFHYHALLDSGSGFLFAKKVIFPSFIFWPPWMRMGCDFFWNWMIYYIQYLGRDKPWICSQIGPLVKWHKLNQLTIFPRPTLLRRSITKIIEKKIISDSNFDLRARSNLEK